MKKDQIFAGIGFSLIGLCFILSLSRMFQRISEESDPKLTTIRFSHWQLESGIREGFDAVAQEYMRLHPNVRVIQEPVPEKIYTNWIITQLVGETAPDLVLLGGVTDERLARYFVPITPYVNQSNPYNQGTDLEKLPWRETYLDGMEGAYNPNLLEYYSAPFAMHVIRLFYNKELLKKISGRDDLPTDYDAFLQLCHQIQDYAQKSGEVVIPIAGSKYNSAIMVGRFFSTQTQRMVDRPSMGYLLRPDVEILTPRYWENEWSLNDPEIRSGLEMMHEIGLHMQPGFMQLQREDATFYFVQQRAVMIASGSWDRSSVRTETQGRFTVGVCALPSPSPASPRFGKYVLGPVSEASTKAFGGFGIPRSSKSFDVALDFERFLCSRIGNQIFVNRSGWLPAIAGVKIPEELKAFEPQLNGYPEGFALQWSPNVKRVVENELNQLYQVTGGVDRFISALKPKYAEALAEDSRNNIRGLLRNTFRMETAFGALLELQKQDPHDSHLENKIAEMNENMVMAESHWMRGQYDLRQAGYNTKP
ncbi:MAG: extracellular solute-binding protein [Verrucomicrobiota bacterium]